MSVRPLAKIITDDLDLTRLQHNVEIALRPLLTTALLDGAHIANVALVNGTTVVPHRLGRLLRGWETTRRRGPATIWDGQDTNATQDKTLVLHADAAVTVDLYVY